VKRLALVVPVVVLAVVGALSLTGGRATRVAAAAAEVPPSTGGVVVDGLGKVSGTPDVLRVVVGVSVRRADVSTALRDANSRQNRVRAALRRDGVQAVDLQTAGVDVGQAYDVKGQRAGYQVGETLTAKLRDLARAGRAISDAVLAGGDAAVLQGVTFDLEDNAALLSRARDAAYADARAKAQRYADLSGRRLGQVQLVTESASVPPVPRQYLDASTAGASVAAVPLDPGSAQVSVSVTVRWALS
jgi:uncharacterized protein YggE